MLPVSLPSNPDDAEETSTIPLPKVLPIPLIREIPPPVFELLLPPEISIEPPEAEGCWALPAKTAMSPATNGARHFRLAIGRKYVVIENSGGKW